MTAIIKGPKALTKCIKNITCWLRKRAKKEPRKLKGKPRALTPIQILQKLA